MSHIESCVLNIRSVITRCRSVSQNKTSGVNADNLVAFTNSSRWSLPGLLSVKTGGGGAACCVAETAVYGRLCGRDRGVWSVVWQRPRCMVGCVAETAVYGRLCGRDRGVVSVARY